MKKEIRVQIVIVFVVNWLVVLLLINKTIESKTTALTLFGIIAWWLGVFCEVILNSFNMENRVGWRQTGKEKEKTEESKKI